MSPNPLFARKLAIFLSGIPLFQTQAKAVVISCLGKVTSATKHLCKRLIRHGEQNDSSGSDRKFN